MWGQPRLISRLVQLGKADLIVPGDQCRAHARISRRCVLAHGGRRRILAASIFSAAEIGTPIRRDAAIIPVRAASMDSRSPIRAPCANNLAIITYSGGAAVNLTTNRSAQFSDSVSRVRRVLQRRETVRLRLLAAMAA